MAPTLLEHLDPSRSPKRILALDGGGMRGMLSLGILERVEQIVGSPLSDHFDLIGGTSTGALIAAKLATGSPVAEIVELYDQLGASVFKRSWLPFRSGVLRAKYPNEPLKAALDQQFGDMQLGDPNIVTGLAIVAKRIDTGSPWIVHNNPHGLYYETDPSSSSVANKNYTLKRLLLASTAAPHYFDPVNITVAAESDRTTSGVFIDGGASPHNNPALLLLMLSTLDGYQFNWPLGAERLQIVSVGTGTWKPTTEPRGTIGSILAKITAAHAVNSLLSMMYDASALNEQLLQWMSNSPTSREIDSEVGNLNNDLLGLYDPNSETEPLLSYVRYDAPIEHGWLNRNLPDLDAKPDEIIKLRKMDRPSSLKALREIGQVAADLVRPEHLVAKQESQ